MKRIAEIIIAVVFCLTITYNFCSKNPVSGNNSPTITSIIAEKNMVDLGESISIRAIYIDIDRDSLNVQWSATAGVFSEVKGDSVLWVAPDTPGSAAIILEIDDYRGGSDIDSVVINIQNLNPEVSDITITPKNVFLENTAVLKVIASDPDGHEISFSWSAERDGKSVGTFVSSSGDSAVWIAPSTSGAVEIKVIVRDEKGGETVSTKIINVYSAIGSVWLSDTFNNRVIMLSSTGDIMYELGGFNNPKGIDLNKNDRTVLVADWGNNRIVKISAGGKIINQISGFYFPHSVSIMSFDGTAWVCQGSDSIQVVKLSTEGNIIKKINGLSNPLSIAVDQSTPSGDVWVTDTGNNRVVKLYYDIPDGYDINNPPSGSGKKHDVSTDWDGKDFSNPVGITVNSSTGDCWFADKGNNRVIRILKDGSKIHGIYGLSGPECVSVNKKNSEAWITDTLNDRIIKIWQGIFDSDVPYDVSIHSGFHDPEIIKKVYRQPISISVNSNTGEVWFTEESRAVRIAPDGSIMEVTGFNAPKGIVVNPGVE